MTRTIIIEEVERVIIKQLLIKGHQAQAVLGCFTDSEGTDNFHVI